jgi:hypothetical protein
VNTNANKVFSTSLTMTYNLFFLLTGDPGREALDPCLLGKMVKIERGSNLLNQIFNLIARYVWKVHADEHICGALRYFAGRSFLDVIGPSDIVYIILMIKNSKDMWDQDIHVQELEAEGMENTKMKLKPLFTSGSGQNRTQGYSLWNLEGMKYFHQAEKQWRQVYDNKKDMRVLYNGWERWIATMGADIKIGDGSKKTFQTVMGSWHEDFFTNFKDGEKQDDEETLGLEGGYSSDGRLSRHSLNFHIDKFGENLSDESKGE